MNSNVVLIFVDALRADHVGCLVGEDRGTPNIDRLAGEGVAFPNAVSQAPGSRPSVASLMTGLYPSQLLDKWRVADSEERAGLNPAVTTLAEVLTAQGYSTAAFLGGNADLKPKFGLMRGFARAEWIPTADGGPVVEAVERWLDSKPAEPAFCYVHFHDVHSPLPVTTSASPLDGGHDLDLLEASTKELLGHYAAAVRRADAYVGRVIEMLDAAGVLEDSVVVIAADHGQELMEHGAMMNHGRTLYREVVHVPLIIRLPGSPRPGARVTRPVGLVNLMPTILDALGVPSPPTAGKSLLPLIHGEEDAVNGESFAFSQLLRRSRYIQSVTTESHQLIETYLLEEAPIVSPADLEPGMTVEVKGQFVDSGTLLATRAELSHPELDRVHGAVQEVDPAAGTVTVMGLTFRVDGGTSLVGRDKQPFDLGDIEAGEIVSANFSHSSDGRPTAKMLKRRRPGGKSKLEGLIERTEERGGGVRLIWVLGVEVVIPPDANIGPLKAKREEGDGAGKVDVVSRVLSGEYVAAESELYDIAENSAQSRSILEERPEVAEELREVLARWIGSLQGAGVAERGADAALKK
jgi:Sulfatase/Domain of unknown function (DUF5666)